MSPRSLSLALTYALAACGLAATLLAPLPRGAPLLLLAAGLAGGIWDRRDRRPVPARALTVLGLLGFALSLLPLRRETLAEQSLTALCFLLAVKLLGAKRARDHQQVLGVSLMLVAGSASLSPELGYAPLLLLVFLIAAFQLIWLPFTEEAAFAPVPRAFAARLAALGGLLLGLSLPLAAVIFLVLPRAVNPFWGGLSPRARAVSGFSDQLLLGEVGRIALSPEVAFRADLEDFRGPLPRVPYWRGAVLEQTDGRRWRTAEAFRPASRTIPGPGMRITYYAEPHGERQLFLLESPISAALGARTQQIGAARILRLALPLSRRIRYHGHSLPADRFPERLTAQERERNLELPLALDPRVRELAGRLTAGESEPGRAAARVAAHFAAGFTYALEVPASGADPLAEFLFRHRTGYCEYFAAACTLLLRAAGIPARLVSGYLGGEYNAAGNYYLVTQSAAHAWVEAHLGEAGWVRLDPTPAALEFGATFASRRAAPPRLWLDTLRMRWNSWIIQYDSESQLSVARSVSARLRAGRLRPPPGLLAGAAAAALLVSALLALGRLRRARGSGEAAARYRRFERLAQRRGARRLPHEGPLDHARRFAEAAPAGRAEILRFGELYARARYGGTAPTPACLREMDGLLAGIAARGRGGPFP